MKFSKIKSRVLHLLIISAIIAIFGALTVVGVSAKVEDTFTVNTVEGAPITYRVTSEGAFPEVEVVDCQQDYKGAVTLHESVVNSNNNLKYTVTSIENGVFWSCYELTSITIPSSIENIGSNSFYFCNNLSDIYCWNSEPPSLGRYSVENCASNLKIYIPYGTKDAYVDAGWPEDNLFEVVRTVKVIDKSGAPIEGAKVTIYLKKYTPFALTGGYTNSKGIYTPNPAEILCDTVEVKKSGYKQVETRVSDNFELGLV